MNGTKGQLLKKNRLFEFTILSSLRLSVQILLAGLEVAGAAAR